MLSPWEWHVDVDQYIVPYLFSPPRAFSRDRLLQLLGAQARPRRPIGNVACIFWAFVGTVSSLSVISVVGRHVSTFQAAGTPLTIGSFGAAAVLEFYTIESPLSQPRNAILGQLISSVIGVAVNKGFARLPGSSYNDLRWLAGALSCAGSTMATALTGTVHPPGGATALLAVTDPKVAEIGWALVPMVLLNCGVMLAVALLVNNIQREFPTYWWTPADVGSFWARKRPGHGGEEADLAVGTCGEKGPGQGGSDFNNSSGATVVGSTSYYDVSCSLMLTRDGISVPPHLDLLPEEKDWLESLCRRL
ncbi:hypothetical protein VP1G_06930 [Cytospora mali]|uniref:HPP transmembrane region domain-containing protein n=1 Tax=Cytospora mali TaxID=578113 RepID=A0A194V737_CYTMA|nr:hypothetical protein VP1G_06930 [Valsa mali var. pyri (nom. inval.)]